MILIKLKVIERLSMKSKGDQIMKNFNLRPSPEDNRQTWLLIYTQLDSILIELQTQYSNN